MKTKNFVVSFKLNKKDLPKFTDKVVNYLESENFSQYYDFDYKCSKLILSSRYLFEVAFYDLVDSIFGMIFISAIMSRSSNFCFYPVEVSHITFNSLNKD